MTSERDTDRDELRLQAMLRSVDADALPVDAGALQSIRDRAAAEFARAADSSAVVPDATPIPAAPLETPIRSQRRRSMLTIALRGSLALAAVVALGFAWMNPFGPQQVSGAAVPFSKVLAELQGASTLHLQLDQSGQTSEILVRSPGLVRKQESEQRYQIAAGSRLWKVDEAENRVEEVDSPWFDSPSRQVDLLKLLDLGIQDASALLVAKPVERLTHHGRDCYRYQVDLPTERGRIDIEAFADVGTNQLVDIVARDAKAKNALPVAELRLIAMNKPVADDDFKVATSLTEDGRIGSVTDAQGIVVLRPMLAKRWTPVCRETLLRPGDWLRTELRGANAVKVRLSSDVELVLGPGTLIECVSPKQARLHTGQAQVQVAKANAGEFQLLAPKAGSRSFKAGDKQLVRLSIEQKIIDVTQTPVWLAGFEGTSNNESLGSLIVNLPDGRNEPLTVGEHKVSVEIRDQIARTTIEETFVNHTPSRLEGVFHFPLPQDASISGFGMWIGNELVEADVVEKQRAREIFETILREKRDPGLLEWMGGNIFKARVFPIEPHSEKRVKIVYTQVLPLRANRYRYSYGLRSEMLRTKPLRELSLNVVVNSALPLKTVSSPTHAVRALQTRHSAQLDFAAQEYTPTRDFEIVCEIDAKQSDVVVIPHRRGDDGYLLVQLTPPSAEGNWQRELLPDGKPLNVVLLCDTSSSMDLEKRRQQAEFVGTVLTSLGEGDRFQLACADVGTAWVSPEPLAATAENIARARAFLDERISLGWTNLDRAFADILQKVTTESHVIYVGDGIVSAESTDATAFVERLRQLAGAANPNDKSAVRRTLHSVTVGNTHETVVLKGIAAVGHGSMRSISGEQTPQMVALELLNEIAQPGLRDLNVEFRGLKVAAVYPDQLPNVAAGTQQILVGRYLPEGKDQSGEIIVTGIRGTEKVKYAARISLKDAEEGNSFIPRLWARAHLDHLLAQGQSERIREEIIGLSEQFHIITPYTSLLVLESDADRQRFGVTRRYEMRDGEKFFAEGRDNANFELLQTQMKMAGDWRTGMRRKILRELRGLGRNSQTLQQLIQRNPYLNGYEDLALFGRSGGGGWANGPMGGAYASYAGGMGGMGGGMGGMGLVGGLGMDYMDGENALGDFAEMDKDANGVIDELRRAPMSLASEMEFKEESLEELSKVAEQDEKGLDAVSDSDFEEMHDMDGLLDLRAAGGKRKALRDQSERQLFDLSKSVFDDAFVVRQKRIGRGVNWYGPGPTPQYTQWVNTLFQPLAAVPKPQAAAKDPETWSVEAIAVSKSLLRTESLKGLVGGVELRRTSDSFDPRWNRRSARHSDLVLYSKSGWVTRSLDLNEQTIVNYATPQVRGVYSQAFLLGRQRASVEAERGPDPLGLVDSSIHPLHELFRDRTARVEAAGDGQVKLIVTLPMSTLVEHYLIDTTRHVLLKHESIDNGKVNSAVTWDDFVDVAGTWWARKSIRVDQDGQKVSETTLELKALDPADYAQRMDAELAAIPTVQFIQLPFVKLDVARQMVADGKAGFEHRLAMVLHEAQSQQWDEMWKHVDAIEKLAADKPGIRWIRTMLLEATRRNEEAQARMMTEARNLVAARRQDELFLAEFIIGHTQGLCEWHEFVPFVQLLKPVYERQPADVDAMLTWTDRMAQCHDGVGNSEQGLALRKSLAESSPWHTHWQTEYARRLSSAGQFDAALAWLKKEIDRPIKRQDYDEETLATAMADLYRSQGQWAGLLKFTTEWIGRKPTSMSYHSAYAQHLAAMVYNDQYDEACALAQKWLTEARVEGTMAVDQRARLEAALNFAMGSAYNLWFQRMDERWYEPLGEAIRFFVRHPHHADIASRIMTHHYFQQSDVADRLRGEFLVMLQSDAARLTPSQLQTLVAWTLSGRMDLPQPINGRKQVGASEIPSSLWKKLSEDVKPRWMQAVDKNEKHVLGETLNSIYSARFRTDLYLPFLRERLESAHVDFKPSYISSLFEALLGTDWTSEIEKEAFARLRTLSALPDANGRLMIELPALYRLVDAMLANRQAAGERVLHDQGGTDKLTRKELAAKKAEIRATAQSELAARLGDEARTEDGPLADWLKIEQTWINVQLGKNLDDVGQACWKILGEGPPKPVADPEDVDDVVAIVEPIEQVPDPDFQKKRVDGILRQRAFVTVFNLAVRRTAKPEEVERLFKYVDTGIAQGKADGARRDTAQAWRSTKARILIALDRPEDLERELRAWIRDDVSTGPWRQALARLLAERGKLEEAIPLFEACDQDKLLTAGDKKLLADWYLVVNRRADYERSRIEAYKAMPEDRLNQMLYQICNRWQQQDPQLTTLDEDTLFLLKALFEKSASPENYLWQLRAIYAGSHDFRVLQVVPDALLGRSPQQIYSFLQSLNSEALSEVRNEATADEILARIRVLRTDERTPTDLRALDLLEALVERKSSELLNQPGPHIDGCVAALKRAFDRKWGDGEPRMMAGFLARLGRLPDKLSAEQLREMRELQKLTPEKSRDHLTITADLCTLIGASYQKLDEAIREMQVEVRNYTQEKNGRWPHEDDQILSGFVSLYEMAGQYAAGESVLLGYLARPEHDTQRKWLDDRLMALYNQALESDAAVSLGSGRGKLFGPLYKRHLDKIEQSLDENERYALVSRLTTTFDIAARHKIPGGSEAATNFGFEVMPGLLKRQTAQYRNTVVAPIRGIADLAGPKAALKYVVERMEQYPQRLEIAWENSWQTLGYELAARRQAVGNSDLDDRVLKLTIRELQRELRTGEHRNNNIYHQHNQYFWAEKVAAFAAAAEATLAEKKTSGRRVMAVASYLWHGIPYRERAIEILFIAHQQGILDENAQIQLVRWLQESQRFAESIPLLEALVVARPDAIEFRTMLMTAYHQSKRAQQLTDLIKQTHDHFHAGGRWTEGNAAALGQACAGCSQHELAVTYMTEAIALHQRANPGSGLNDGTLANYYGILASSQSILGNTKAAVDAASAAIVCWSARHGERGQQIETLKQVLSGAEDLDDYVAFLDAESAKTGQDSAILRKAIGMTWQSRNELAKAVTQLQLAVELQPNDSEIHRALITCLDQLGKPELATKQLLKLIDLRHHDLALYQELAGRLQGNEEEAERAATSIIESSPGEAENHSAMAELRQQQDRWDEAIRHWIQVAELRKLEPTGLLKLTAAQIHQQRWGDAKISINKLRKTEWPQRFNNVQNETTQLENAIPME